MTRAGNAFQTGQMSMDMMPKSGVQMMEDEKIQFGENPLKGGLLSDNTPGQTTRMETLFPKMKTRMKTGICLVSTNKNIITNLILTVLELLENC